MGSHQEKLTLARMRSTILRESDELLAWVIQLTSSACEVRVLTDPETSVAWRQRLDAIDCSPGTLGVDSRHDRVRDDAAALVDAFLEATGSQTYTCSVLRSEVLFNLAGSVSSEDVLRLLDADRDAMTLATERGGALVLGINTEGGRSLYDVFVVGTSNGYGEYLSD